MNHKQREHKRKKSSTHGFWGVSRKYFGRVANLAQMEKQDLILPLSPSGVPMIAPAQQQSKWPLSQVHGALFKPLLPNASTTRFLQSHPTLARRRFSCAAFRFGTVCERVLFKGRQAGRQDDAVSDAKRTCALPSLEDTWPQTSAPADEINAFFLLELLSPHCPLCLAILSSSSHPDAATVTQQSCPSPPTELPFFFSLFSLHFHFSKAHV